jgi:hypothetical protein
LPTSPDFTFEGAGKSPSLTLPTSHLTSLRDLATSQDLIGWRNMLERKISKHFFALQDEYLAGANTLLTTESWIKSFISKLLHITHSQRAPGPAAGDRPLG